MVARRQILGIIPARGGSKRIPGKNLINLAGKPMIGWTIEAALKSKSLSRVIVSTDDTDIAEISKKWGAEVPFLRDKNADNHSPVSLATIRTLNQLEENERYRPEIVVQLMANCPLRDEKDIDLAVNNFLQNRIDFQISAFKYGWMNPWWAHRIESNGKTIPIFSDDLRKKRSQDLPELYCPTGAIWIANVSKLMISKSFYGVDYSFYPMPWVKAIDIDDYNDLEMANFFIKKVNEV